MNNHRKFKSNKNMPEKPREKTPGPAGSGLGLFQSLLNPKNVTSMQTIELNKCDSNVYIQTMNRIEDPYRSSSRRQKITIIKKKRRKDGSVEHYKQNIFKDYDDAYAQKDAARLRSTLHNYRSSVKIRNHGNSKTIADNPTM